MLLSLHGLIKSAAICSECPLVGVREKWDKSTSGSTSGKSVEYDAWPLALNSDHAHVIAAMTAIKFSLCISISTGKKVRSAHGGRADRAIPV